MRAKDWKNIAGNASSLAAQASRQSSPEARIINDLAKVLQQVGAAGEALAEEVEDLRTALNKFERMHGR
jgi:hypothetical protein